MPPTIFLRARRPIQSALRKIRRHIVPGEHARRSMYGGIVLSLQVLEKTAVFPPVQSVAGGILVIHRNCESMTKNARDHEYVFERLRAACQSIEAVGSQPSSRLQAAIRRYDQSLQVVKEDLQSNRTTKSPKHFFMAQRHKERLSDLLSKLKELDDDLRRELIIDIHALLQEPNRAIITPSLDNPQPTASTVHESGALDIVSLGESSSSSASSTKEELISPTAFDATGLRDQSLQDGQCEDSLNARMSQATTINISLVSFAPIFTDSKNERHARRLVALMHPVSLTQVLISSAILF